MFNFRCIHCYDNTCFKQVANVPVRNAGTIAGNLMVKHAHPEFPSDLALTLSAAGAIITVSNISGEKRLSADTFLQENMTMKVLTKIELPPMRQEEVFR